MGWIQTYLTVSVISEEKEPWSSLLLATNHDNRDFAFPPLDVACVFSYTKFE